MPEVRLTMEEYQALVDASPGSRMIVLDKYATSGAPKIKKARSKPKRKGKKDPKMAKALRKANSMMRTKSGKLRKGATQAKIMKKAHQLRRKM